MKEEERKMMRRKVLDAYFTLRQPMPQDGSVQQNRTTEEIQDDMAAMMDVSKEEIIEYMTEHDYNPTTDTDGTVKWAIWRIT